MSVVAQRIDCPSCGAVVDVALGEGTAVVGAGVGHREDEAVLNQRCTGCLAAIHVALEEA